MWLHVKIGQILTGLEDVRGAVHEMREAASSLNNSQAELRLGLSRMIGKLDATTARVTVLEGDVRPLADMNGRLSAVETGMKKLEPRVEALDKLRWKAMGVVVAFTALGFMLEIARDLLAIKWGYG